MPTNQTTRGSSGRDTGREAVILAGGKGVRLRPYTTLLPKPLVPIGETHSILEIVLRQLGECGFTRAVLAVGHLGQLVRAYVGDGSQWGIHVDYHTEEAPLGTIGPALQIAEDLPEEFLLMNGDILTDLDYGALLEFHRGHGAPMTVATYEREHRVDFGVLEVDGAAVRGFTEKPTLRYSVSMGVYALSRSTLADYPVGMPFGFDELILDQLGHGRTPASFPFDGYWLDIGRPDDYDRANEEFPAIRDHLLGIDRKRRSATVG